MACIVSVHSRTKDENLQSQSSWWALRILPGVFMEIDIIEHRDERANIYYFKSQLQGLKLSSAGTRRPSMDFKANVHLKKAIFHWSHILHLIHFFFLSFCSQFSVPILSKNILLLLLVKKKKIKWEMCFCLCLWPFHLLFPDYMQNSATIQCTTRQSNSSDLAFTKVIVM